MRIFGLLFAFQGAFFIDCVMSHSSYITLHYRKVHAACKLMAIKSVTTGESPY